MDGSKVTGKQVAVAPAAAGNIPMQLVKTEPAMGNGAMTGITYIQRVNTKGGVAPCRPVHVGRRGLQEDGAVPGGLRFLQACSTSFVTYPPPVS